MTGHLIVGLSEDELNIVLNVPDVQRDASGWSHIVFSPEQAIALGEMLLKKARECRRAERTFDQTPAGLHPRTPKYTCLVHEYHGNTPCRQCNVLPRSRDINGGG